MNKKQIQKPINVPFLKIANVDLSGEFQSATELADKFEPLFYHHQLSFKNVRLVFNPEDGYTHPYFEGQMKDQKEINEEIERREYQQYLKLKEKYDKTRITAIGDFP